MEANPNDIQRKDLRLHEYDYSTPGAYFVTIVAFDRLHLFATIAANEVRLSQKGVIVDETWKDLYHHIGGIELDTSYVIMPNHFHGIVFIKEPELQGSTKAPNLAEIVRQFKSFSARRINQEFKTPGNPVWQRSYYDHIIRNEADLFRGRDYISANQYKWATDEYNPIG